MELLPCPFCGAGTTRVVMNGQTWTGTKYSDPISVSVVHHCDPIEGQPSRQIERIGRDAESAIAAWNRRASPNLATPVLNRIRAEGMRMAADFVEPQRNDIPACGFEFAADIRAKADELEQSK